ncbi:hypothetical protein Tco_1355330 [Tanacetum coccineum]
MKLMQFLMGLDEYYQPVRSSLFIRDPLPEVKDAYNMGSREESHRGVHESSGVIEGSASNVNKGPNPNLNCKHYGKIGHAIDRCFEIVGFLQGFKRNSNTGKQTFNVNADVKMNDKPPFLVCLLALLLSRCKSCLLKITIGHPNGTLATIIHVGNLKLTNNVVLYDVFVVPGYCVSLLSINKLIRDSNMVVGFDENKCLDEYYPPVRSSLFIKDPLPKVNDAYNMVSRQESYRGVPESFGVIESN